MSNLPNFILNISMPTHLMAYTEDEKQPFKPIIAFTESNGQIQAMTLNLNGIMIPLNKVRYYFYKNTD